VFGRRVRVTGRLLGIVHFHGLVTVAFLLLIWFIIAAATFALNILAAII